MTVDELKSMLDGIDGDKEVRLAMQPSWPFEYSISFETAETDEAFYLSEGSQLDYLSGEVSEQLGWH